MTPCATDNEVDLPRQPDFEPTPFDRFRKGQPAVHQPAADRGRLAANLLLDRLAGERKKMPIRVTVDPQFIERAPVCRLR
jgi:DNA-binding LacI/PurR family transcriptional regulator